MCIQDQSEYWQENVRHKIIICKWSPTIEIENKKKKKKNLKPSHIFLGDLEKKTKSFILLLLSLDRAIESLFFE